jgi:BA14K-like protein
MIGFKILSTVAVLALVAAPAASFAQRDGKAAVARGPASHGGGGMRAGGAGARGFSGGGGGGGARFSGGGYRGGYANRGGGGAVVPGLIAGAVVGGALASSNYYGGPGYAPGYYDDQYDDGPVAVAPQVGGDDSVGYCMQTYRSYDPRSGTYLGNDGYRHPCP